jgi:pSer/pThr/pTyr-binding forkhead associated (FHA) protein
MEQATSASQFTDFPALVLVNGETPGKQWILEKDEMTLGRDDICDIVIPMRQISRQHVTFRRVNPYVYVIEDLESKNGTWLNGNRIEGFAHLSDGDEIHIALKAHLRFIGSGITAPATQDLPRVIPTSKNRRMQLDVEARRVYIDANELDPPLSLPQYRLLELLYVNSERVCTRNEVVDTVWPDAVVDGVSEQAIDALVRRLRDRLAEVDSEHQYVVTVRGHGFRLDNPTTA